VNLRPNCPSLFDRATDPGLKLAFQINTIADFVQSVIEIPSSSFVSFTVMPGISFISSISVNRPLHSKCLTRMTHSLLHASLETDHAPSI